MRYDPQKRSKQRLGPWRLNMMDFTLRGDGNSDYNLWCGFGLFGFSQRISGTETVVCCTSFWCLPLYSERKGIYHPFVHDFSRVQTHGLFQLFPSTMLDKKLGGWVVFLIPNIGWAKAGKSNGIGYRLGWLAMKYWLIGRQWCSLVLRCLLIELHVFLCWRLANG